MRDQEMAATEALLPGLCAPSIPDTCPEPAFRSTAVRQTRGRGEASAHAPPWLTAIYGGLLKQPYKQKAAKA